MKRLFLLATALATFISSQTFSQPAGLDASFGNNGIGLYTIPNESAIAFSRFSFLQSNGKLILGGSMGELLGFVRLRPDGRIDSSFGGDGRVLSQPPSGPAIYNTGIMRPDGKFVVAGSIGADMLVLRYLPSGALDKTFNGNGQQVISIEDGSDRANAVALQPDGKIIVCGHSHQVDHEVFSIARLNLDGTLDEDFYRNGTRAFEVSGFGDEECFAVAIQPDGKILMAGTSYDANNHPQFSIVRLDANGFFDNTFNGTGKQVIPVAGLNGYSYAGAMAIQPDGKILIAGMSLRNGSRDFNMAIARLNQNGNPDHSFDVDGKMDIALAANEGRDEANAITVDANGKIVIGGRSYNGLDDDYAVVRLNTDGSFDLSFDGDGRETIPVGSYSDLVYSMIVTVDKIILAGYSGNNLPTGPQSNMISDLLQYSIARLNFDGSLDNSFDGDGKKIIETGSLNDEVNAADIGPNGGILLAGSSLKFYNYQAASVMRLTPVGQPDNNFSDDGRLILKPNYPNADDGNNYAVLRVAGGNIMLAGETNSSQTGTHDFLITRLTGAGVPDAGFGISGYATVNTGTNDTATCMAIQADGKIVVAGCSSSFLNGTVVSIARLLDNGTPDNTFGSFGKKTIIIGLGASKVYSIAIQPDGKILMAGFSLGTLSGYDFTAIRLNTNGSLDNTFGSGGKLVVSLGSFNDICYSMKLQPDGKIILAGVAGPESARDFAVVRLNSNGSLDNTFDGDGKKIIPIGTGNDIARSIALQQDGKIIVAGYSYNGKDNDPAIIRLNVDGSLDNNFDADGKAVFNYQGTGEIINAVNVQADGKIVLAGKQTPPNENYGAGYFVMRLLGGNSPNAVASEKQDRLDNGSLKQNMPNPFMSTTTVEYSLPENFSSAKLIITNKNGIPVKHTEIYDVSGKITINASTLMPGIYYYSLYADGKLIDTKQMVLAK